MVSVLKCPGLFFFFIVAYTITELNIVVYKKILLNQNILTMWPEPENMNYTIKKGIYGQYYHAFSFSQVNMEVEKKM